MKNQITALIRVLALHLFLCISVFAQSYYSTDNPGKDYWQVYTDIKTGNTIVQFFNSANRLIYKEILPKKYIKLNKKNIRYFDNLLSKLTQNNLLASTVKSYELVADSRTTFRDISRPINSEEYPAHHSTNSSNVYLAEKGKLTVIFKNPFQENVNILFLDEQARKIYNEGISEASYHRTFDLAKLTAGVYKVYINSPRTKLYYRITVDDYNGYSLEHLE